MDPFPEQRKPDTLSERVGTWAFACALLVAALPGIAVFSGIGEALEGALTAIVLGVFSIMCASAFMLRHDNASMPRSLAILAPVPLLVLGGVGLLIFGVSRDMVFGTGFQFGTVGSFVLGAVAFLCGVLVRPARARILITAVCIVGALSIATVVWDTAEHASPSRANRDETIRLISLQYSDTFRNTIIGDGPASFPETWSRYRDTSFNMTRWWNVNPAGPFSDIAGIALSFGLVGIAALLLVPIAVLMAAYSAHAPRRGVVLSAGALMSVSYAALAAFPAGVGVFVIGSVCAGIALSATEDRPLVLGNFARMFTIVVLLISGAGVIGTGVLQAQAARTFARGEALVSSDITQAVYPLDRAASMWPVSEYEIGAAQAMLSAGMLIAEQQKSKGNSVDLEKLKGYIEGATRLSGYAAIHDPNNVDVAVARAALYAVVYASGFTTFADPSGQRDISELTRSYLNTASVLDRTRADVVFDQAVFAKLTGDTTAARAFAERALRLKPDYEEARELLRSLGS